MTASFVLEFCIQEVESGEYFNATMVESHYKKELTLTGWSAFSGFFDE